MRRGLGAAAVILAGATAFCAAAVAGTPPRPHAAQAPKPGGTSNGANSTQGAAPPATSHGLHYVTVTFDYDFSRTPACSEKVTTKCVQEFVAYDISAGVKNRIKLFEIPLPAKAEGVVKGITGKSPTKLDFESGKHLIAVVAREPDGTESMHRACTTWIQIP